jgi:hypothetical protein
MRLYLELSEQERALAIGIVNSHRVDEMISYLPKTLGARSLCIVFDEDGVCCGWASSQKELTPFIQGKDLPDALLQLCEWWHKAQPIYQQ